MTTAQVAQDWINQAVEACQNDPERGIWNVREAKKFSNVKLLLRRWKALNAVTGASMVDTWGVAMAIGLAIAAVLTGALGYLGQERLGEIAIMAGFGFGAPVGLLVGYNRFITMVYRETYIEVIVNEHQTAISHQHESEDTVVAFLPRLGYILRPDAIEGNQGATGFRDKDARIRLQTVFGQSYHDLRSASDFYNLPTDENWLEQAANMERYSIETMVRSAGHLYRRYGVPLDPDDLKSKFSGIWHWILLLAAFALAFFLVAGD